MNLLYPQLFWNLMVKADAVATELARMARAILMDFMSSEWWVAKAIILAADGFFYMGARVFGFAKYLCPAN